MKNQILKKHRFYDLTGKRNFYGLFPSNFDEYSRINRSTNDPINSQMVKIFKQKTVFFANFCRSILKIRFLKVLDFYTEGFSAVNFDCSLNNFRIGNVNLSDALKLIEEITAPGVQVENAFYQLLS